MNTYLCFMFVGAAKSSKSASRFSLNNLQDIASPKSLKKDLAASQSNPEPKGMSTRGKGTKREKPAETSEGLPLMERQLHDYVSEVRILYPKILLLLRIWILTAEIFLVQKFAEIQILMDQRLAEAEEKNLDFQKIALAKDKKISSVEKDINMLQKELLLAEITTQKERMEIMDGAKLSATIAMLEIKLQMAKEAAHPSLTGLNGTWRPGSKG
ncbi:hypothetical protein Hanom_Chr14g01253231 [Helianthus anomalus]